MRNRFFIFLALLCVMAQMASATPIVVSTDADLRAAVLINHANIQLGADIDLSNSTLSIPADSTVTIDMNGHKLDRKLTKRGEGGGQVITVREGATLNLSNGTLAGGWGGNAGGLSNESGTVNLTDVTITGCTGDDKGGGICNLGGTLTMNGGALTNNRSNDHDDPTGGGGIFNAAGATATLTGVTITGNSVVAKGGGGICNYGTMTLDACTITGNHCQMNGGGIYTAVGATLNLKGTMTITGNTTAGNATNNLFLKTGVLITVTGPLTDSHIGIICESIDGVITSGFDTYNAGIDPSTIFTPDYSGVIVTSNGAQEARLTFYYIERSWDEQNKQIVSTRKLLTNRLDENIIATHDEDYYVFIPREDVPGIGNFQCTIDQHYIVSKDYHIVQAMIMGTSGHIHLILCDGVTLTIDDGILVEGGEKLYIHSQSYGTSMGKLVVTSNVTGGSHGYYSVGHKVGIGGYAGKDDYGSPDKTIGDIYIHGGDLDIKSGPNHAAIGGDRYSKVGDIIIYGGTIKAVSGDGAAGIGNGSDSEDYGNIVIYGGNINATGGTSPGGAGIGGGNKNKKGNLHICGGTTIAYGGHEAAGIGCGQNASNSGAGHVVISGGEVHGIGDDYGAGIGGGDGVNGGTVEITGGLVYAYGGTDAAGIGGGEGGKGGTVTISGGYVLARGNDNGAGIGGGEDADGGSVTITGGTVVAETTGEDEGSRAIGPGDGSDNYGSLVLGDELMVTSERKAHAAERKNMCWYRTNVTIEPCDHSSITYTVDGVTATDHHIAHCDYCLHTDTALHHFVNGECTVCHVQTTLDTVTLWMPQAPFDGKTYRPVSSVKLVPNTSYILPLASLKIPHYKFIGWEARTDLEGVVEYVSPYTTEPADTLYRTGDKYTVTADIAFVPRYRLMDITLYDNAQNGRTLAENNGETVNTVTLSGRTFAKDGNWQTLALPFALSTGELSSSPLKDAIIKQLDLDGYYDDAYTRYDVSADGRHQTGYDTTSNTLYLYFADTTAMAAGKPYVFKWESGNDTVNPVFANVTLTNQTADVYAPGFGFHSLYGPNRYTEERDDIVYLGANNTFLQPDGSDITIGAFRAYFNLMYYSLLLTTSENPLTIVTNLDGAVVPTEVDQVQSDKVRSTKVLRDGQLLIIHDGKIYNALGVEIK